MIHLLRIICVLIVSCSGAIATGANAFRLTVEENQSISALFQEVTNLKMGPNNLATFVQKNALATTWQQLEDESTAWIKLADLLPINQTLVASGSTNGLPPLSAKQRALAHLVLVRASMAYLQQNYNGMYKDLRLAQRLTGRLPVIDIITFKDHQQPFAYLPIMEDEQDLLRKDIERQTRLRTSYTGTFDPLPTVPRIEKRFAERDPTSAYQKAEGLLYGLYGYASNTKQWSALMDKMLADHDANAVSLKIEDLVTGSHGSPKDLTTAKALIEAEAARLNKYALERKLDGLFRGSDLYEKDTQAGMALVNKLIAEGQTWAASEIVQLAYDSTDKKIIQTAHETLDKYVALQEDWAITMKARALSKGLYGYKKDEKGARTFIDGLIQKGNAWALYLKLRGMFDGNYGFSEKPNDIIPMINDLADKNNVAAQRLRIQAYANGLSPIYAQDRQIAWKHVVSDMISLFVP